MRHRRVEERLREPERVHLGGRRGAPDDLVGDDVAVEPIRVRETPVPLEVPLVGRSGHERGHGPVAEPLRAERLGKLSVEREARPRKRVEGRPDVPIEGEEPGRLTGRSGPGPGAVDDEGPGAASGQEVGDRRADGARTTDDDAPGYGHGRIIGSPEPGSQRRSTGLPSPSLRLL